MSFFRRIFTAASFLLLAGWACPLSAQDIDNAMVKMQQELSRLQAEVQSVTAARAPAELLSVKKNATLRIGGEINVDYTANIRDRGSRHRPGGVVSGAGWALHRTNLRFTMDLGNGVSGHIKLDLSERPPYQSQEILEEAKIIWKNICGSPFGVVFGKGEIPYGQDRTLGIIQSYHHNDGPYSDEGRTILNGPEPGMLFTSNDGAAPIWHPGETDRVNHAGVTFDWEDILRVEAAAFQPEDSPHNRHLWSNSGFESLALRLWWQTPVEGLVVELSGMRQFLRNRGNENRYGEHARQDSYAFSAGADYFIPETPWEIFAEYQMGINWHYQTGYDTHTVSVGGLYQLTEKIELGLLAEWLRIDAPAGTWDYNKFVAHAKYTFPSRLYVIGEYGFETLNWGGATAHVFAIRSGIDF